MDMCIMFTSNISQKDCPKRILELLIEKVKETEHILKSINPDEINSIKDLNQLLEKNFQNHGCRSVKASSPTENCQKLASTFLIQTPVIPDVLSPTSFATITQNPNLVESGNSTGILEISKKNLEELENADKICPRDECSSCQIKDSYELMSFCISIVISLEQDISEEKKRICEKQNSKFIHLIQIKTWKQEENNIKYVANLQFKMDEMRGLKVQLCHQYQWSYKSESILHVETFSAISNLKTITNNPYRKFSLDLFSRYNDIVPIIEICYMNCDEYNRDESNGESITLSFGKKPQSLREELNDLSHNHLIVLRYMDDIKNQYECRATELDKLAKENCSLKRQLQDLGEQKKCCENQLQKEREQNRSFDENCGTSELDKLAEENDFLKHQLCNLSEQHQCCENQLLKEQEQKKSFDKKFGMVESDQLMMENKSLKQKLCILEKQHCENQLLKEQNISLNEMLVTAELDEFAKENNFLNQQLCNLEKQKQCCENELNKSRVEIKCLKGKSGTAELNKLAKENDCLNQQLDDLKEQRPPCENHLQKEQDKITFFNENCGGAEFDEPKNEDDFSKQELNHLREQNSCCENHLQEELEQNKCLNEKEKETKDQNEIWHEQLDKNINENLCTQAKKENLSKEENFQESNAKEDDSNNRNVFMLLKFILDHEKAISELQDTPNHECSKQEFTDEGRRIWDQLSKGCKDVDKGIEEICDLFKHSFVAGKQIFSDILRKKECLRKEIVSLEHSMADILKRNEELESVLSCSKNTSHCLSAGNKTDVHCLQSTINSFNSSFIKPDVSCIMTKDLEEDLQSEDNHFQNMFNIVRGMAKLITKCYLELKSNLSSRECNTSYDPNSFLHHINSGLKQECPDFKSIRKSIKTMSEQMRAVINLTTNKLNSSKANYTNHENDSYECEETRTNCWNEASQEFGRLRNDEKLFEWEKQILTSNEEDRSCDMNNSVVDQQIEGLKLIASDLSTSLERQREFYIELINTPKKNNKYSQHAISKELCEIVNVLIDIKEYISNQLRECGRNSLSSKSLIKVLNILEPKICLITKLSKRCSNIPEYKTNENSRKYSSFKSSSLETTKYTCINCIDIEDYSTSSEAFKLNLSKRSRY